MIRPEDAPDTVAYSYELKRAGNTVERKVIHSGDFVFPVNKPISQDIPVDEPGDYSVRVEVKDKDGKITTEGFGPVPAGFYTKTRAVVIGISKYLNTDIKQLSFAAHDAESVETLLKFLIPAQNFELHVYKDEAALKDDIFDVLQNMHEDTDFCRSDQFIFYYSGHGFLDNLGDYYLGTYKVDPANLYKTGLPAPALFSLIDKIGQNGLAKKLILLDSCFSGLHQRSSGTHAMQSTGKEEIVLNHKIAPKGTPVAINPNTRDIKNALLRFEETEGTFGAAAEADVPAEEGAVLIQAGKNRHFYFTDELDDSVLSHAKGHGLYTYFLLGNIEREFSSNVELDITDDHHSEFKSNGNCQISFKDAQDQALQDMKEMIKADKTLAKRGQIQEFSYIPGQSHFQPMRCP